MSDDGDDGDIPRIRLFAYMSVKDAIDSRVLSNDKIEYDKVRVHASTSLVRVLADDRSGEGGDTDCERIRDKLRRIRKNSPGYCVYHPFKTIKNQLLSLVKEHSRNGKPVRAHFVVAERETKSQEDSPAVSVEHEVAIEHARRAAVENKLKVYTACGYPGHTPVPIPPDQTWMSIGIQSHCINPIQVNGSGDGLITVTTYNWRPDPGSTERFELDAAVLHIDADGNEQLVHAIEIERSHANSTQKRQAFERHSISNCQISAAEINNFFKSAGIGPRDPVDRNIIVRHHPKSKKERWECPPCTTKRVAVELQQQEAATKEERKKKLLAHYEKQVFTTFDELTPGSYVRAFVTTSRGNTVQLAETGPMVTELKNPRCIQLRIHPGDGWEKFTQTFKPSDPKLVCLRLPTEFQWSEKDRREKVVLSWLRGCFPIKGIPQQEFRDWVSKRMDAQDCLLKYPNRLAIRTMRACGKCVSHEWTAPSGATASLHSANGFLPESNVGSILVHDNTGRVVKAVSVWNLPYKNPSDGPMRPVQICPDSVPLAFHTRDSSMVRLLNTNHSAYICYDCEEREWQERVQEQRRLEELELQEQRRRAEEQRRRAEEQLRRAEEEELQRRSWEEERREREEENERQRRIREQERQKQEEEEELQRLIREEARNKKLRLQKEEQRKAVMESVRCGIESNLISMAKLEDKDYEWKKANFELLNARKNGFDLYHANTAVGNAMLWTMSEWVPGQLVAEQAQASYEDWEKELNRQVTDMSNRHSRILYNHENAKQMAAEYTDRLKPSVVYYWNEQQNIIVKKREGGTGRAFDFCLKEGCVCQSSPPVFKCGGAQ